MSILNQYPRLKRCAIFGVAMIIFVLGVGLGSNLFNSCGHAAIQETVQPAFIHQDDKFIIPQGSALRSRLVVQQVAINNSPHTLVLPAAVEADPSRTINILPPVSGRVVKLDVRLGDRVVKGRPLAIIDSGDLAQAYADDDKARDALQHTERTLERARGLQKIGAGALKDLEQAESDFTGQGRVQPCRSAAQRNRSSGPTQRRLTSLDALCADDRKCDRAHDRARRIRQ